MIQAVTIALEALGLEKVHVDLRFSEQIPVSKGLGSSTADMLSALRNVADSQGTCIDEALLARICHQVEGATDSTMFHRPETILYASRAPATLSRIEGRLPALAIATFDAGEQMGQVETSKVRFRYEQQHVSYFEKALGHYRRGLRKRDAQFVMKAATMSASLNQEFLPIPCWEDTLSVVQKYGLGLQVAHTGTVLGLIADRASVRDLESAAQELERLTEFMPTGYMWPGEK
ncbi:hypothetical protein [Brevibacterium picturae]|uniref:GHMP family kinase ATP-binding protein n=1 Tax=Brevibacterium picturae TaxID=260553 RepID=UPI0031F77D4A